MMVTTPRPLVSGAIHRALHAEGTGQIGRTDGGTHDGTDYDF